MAWCGNEFCKTIYKDEEGNPVPKPESKKKQGKNAPFTSEHSVTEDPDETFFDEVKKFVRILSYYRFPIVVGPGDGESWRIEDSSSWNVAVNRVVTMLRDAGIPVLNPADYIKSHARRDDWHPADTIENRLMQARLSADASYVARGFGFVKQIRHNKTATSHSYNHWPGEFFPQVGGDPDSREQVRALVAQIEENVKNSRTSAATARMSAEAVARAHRSPPAATAPATSSAPTQPKAKMVAAWAPSLPPSPLPPLQTAPTPQAKAPSLPPSPLPPLQTAPTPQAKNRLPSLFAAMGIGSDCHAAASARRDTSDASVSSMRAPSGPDP